MAVATTLERLDNPPWGNPSNVTCCIEDAVEGELFTVDKPRRVTTKLDDLIKDQGGSMQHWKIARPAL